MINNNILQINPQIKNFYQSTSDCISEYNRIQNKIENSQDETTENEDEFLQNYCVYLAHALIKDTGFGARSRDELLRMSRIIEDVLK